MNSLSIFNGLSNCNSINIKHFMVLNNQNYRLQQYLETKFINTNIELNNLTRVGL